MIPIDVRFSSSRWLRARRCNLVRAFHLSDMRGSRYEKVLLYSLILTKRKNLREEIKAETACRKIPLITHEVVYCNFFSLVRHGTAIVKREMTRRCSIFVISKKRKKMRKMCYCGFYKTAI